MSTVPNGLSLHEPSPVVLRRRVDPRALHALFQRSGYLDLREGCTLSPGWTGIDADAVTQDLVYLSHEGTPIGHVSVTRAYGTTWLGHQIAMASGHAQSMEARAALYEAFTALPLAQDGDRAFLLGYFDRTLPWHQWFFGQFAANVPDDHAMVVPWDRFERRRGAPVPAPRADPRVRPASLAEHAALAALAQQALPPLLHRAMALRTDTLESSALHPAYPSTGLARSRKAFGLWEHGRLTAMALCEHTDERLSLFQLMNVAQVFASPAASRSGQRALQDQVRAHYARRGLPDVLLIAPAGTFDGTLDPDVRLEETMGCIVWSAAGLRAYLPFLRGQFARRLQRKEAP